MSENGSEQRPRVLVVDDNEINRKVLRAMLSKLGMDSVEADSGHAAVSSYSNEAFEAVFMDWHMPGMDGLAATGEIRRLETEASDNSDRPARRTPIIAVTACALVGDRERCLEAGMDDYMSKPTTLDVLKEIVAKWIPPEAPDSSSPVATGPSQPIAIDDSVTTTLAHLAKELGDDTIVHRLMETFNDELPKWRSRLETAQQSSDATELALTAHATRSAARSLGFDNLANRCQELETAGRADAARRAEDNQSDQSELPVLSELSELTASVLAAMDAAAEQLAAYRAAQAVAAS